MRRNSHVTIDGHKLPRGVKLLRRLKFAGLTIPVIRSTPELTPELTGEDGSVLHGVFVPSLMLIFISAGQATTVERDSIAHESVHAFIYVTGLGHVLEEAVPDEKVRERLEERLVRVATPHIVALGAFS